MGQFKRILTKIPDIFLLEPEVFSDHRGFFLESYNQRDLEAVGLKANFVQDNISHSSRGVLRGLHFQRQRPQGKLLHVIRGEVFDVAVDLRKESLTYGQWEGVLLSGENHQLFYLPEGFAHGFLVISEEVDFAYKCTDYYCPQGEGSLRWDDPDIAIRWPLGDMGPLLSEKDKTAPLFRDIDMSFVYANSKDCGKQ